MQENYFLPLSQPQGKPFISSFFPLHLCPPTTIINSQLFCAAPKGERARAAELVKIALFCAKPHETNELVKMSRELSSFKIEFEKSPLNSDDACTLCC